MNSALILLLISLVIFHMAWMRARRHSLLAPITVFYLGILQIWMVQALSMSAPAITLYGASSAALGHLLAVLAVVSVIGGYEFSPVVRRSKAYRRFANFDQWRLAVVAVVFVAGGIFLNWLSIQEAGGLAGWDEGIDSRRAINIESGWLRLLGSLLPAGLILLISTTKPMRLIWVIGVLFGVAVLLFYLYSGTRSRSLVLGFSLAGAIAVSLRRTLPIWLILVSFLLGSALSDFLKDHRNEFRGASIGSVFDDLSGYLGRSVLTLLGSETATVQVWENPNYGNEYVLSVGTISLVPDQVPFSPSALEEIVTRPVPSSFWPSGKPYPYYEAATPLFRATNSSENWVLSGRQPILTGPALGFVANYWFVGGGIAVIVFGVLTGIVFRLISDLASGGTLLGGALCLCLVPIGFSEAVATPLFSLFEAPVYLVVLAAALFVSRKVRPTVENISQSFPDRSEQQL